MKLKLFRKETWLKKSTWIITGIFSVALLGIAIPTISKANNTTPGKLDVLEIQPGNKYVLSSNDSIDVTQMDMPTFIGKAEELSGKYDVIYIGRNNNGLSSKWSTDTQYRDYSAGFTQEWLKADGSAGLEGSFEKYKEEEKPNLGDYKWRGQVMWYGPSGNVPINDDGWEWFGKFTSGNFKTTFPDGKTATMVEYYSENDLTTKKLNEIKNFIASGQLVYVDNNVFNDDLKNTKLYQLKNTGIKGVNGNLSSGTITSDYSSISEANKRPEITIVSKPTGDTGEKGTLANRNLEFKYKIKGKDGVTYGTNLYLDYDGNGIFTDDEKVSATTESLDSTGNQENLTKFKLETGFIGYLDWKLEVYNTNKPNIKSYVVGNASFKNILGKKIDINVLQLIPSENCTLNMATNTNFQKLIKEKEVASDYNITVTAMKISEFNNKCNADANYYNSNIKGKINMIVVGFADNYGAGAANQFSENALKVLKDANDNKLSLLFTHDTMNLGILNSSEMLDGSEKNNYTDDKNPFKYFGSKRLTQEFRDIIGQSRYEDPFNPNSGITHDTSAVLGSDKATLGSTAFATVKLYRDYTTSTKVQVINRSQITEYPFELSNDELTVASTHAQWYQLNLEEENLVPAYNLKADTLNAGDTRNFYYTYSKGNITYSGAGHSNISGAEELKLFINTMVKAIRGANQAPILMNKKEDGNIIGDEVIKINADKEFKFVTNVSDDSNPGDPINVTVKTSDGVVLHNNETVPYQRGGIDVSSTLSKEYLENNAGKTITITTTATDKYGETTTASFDVKILLGSITVNHGAYELEYKDANGNLYTSQNRTEDSLTAEEKQPAINEWLGTTSISNSKISSGMNVSYYANVPFVATTTAYANTVLTLEVDENLGVDGEVVVYSRTGDELKNLTTMSKQAENTYTADLGELISQKTDIVVKYVAKPLIQPEDTSTVTANGIQSSTGEAIDFTNTIKVNVAGEDKGTKSATVTVGRVVFDRPLF